MIDSTDIKERGTSLLRYAMHYGAILGLFWMFKYMFKIGAGFSDHVFIYIFYLLNVGTFLLIYIFTFKYKASEPDKPKGIWSCVFFVVLICFFASFFEAVIMYAHYKFIDPGFFMKMTAPFIAMVDKMPNLQPDQKEIYLYIVTGKPLYIISEFIGNMILGVVLGFLMSFLVNSTSNMNNNRP
ncbi:DUF4199 domain-containing protein [uncultured Dysgonomonas sp.]|uniref:DUF4199 domain-containing protein n=1 Tax=uncultured Dysgonomonas sp. TaxID=206096 RepID=A0A212J929_9BACT|nr:DUF4199 domain-containing protein [uncultured Dysgonomonas sp.]SBV95919.1 conserved membrane hypothetical protein [uncultured Dysgonomonas sp.]